MRMFQSGQHNGVTRILRLSSLVFLVSLAIVSNVDLRAQTTDFESLERASQLMQQHQLDAAETLLGSILKATPSDPNALNLLGVIRAQQKRTVEAEKLFLRASRLAPTMIGPNLNLGELYTSTNNMDGAIRAYSRAAQLSPGDAHINLQLAELYDEKNNPVLVLQSLENIPRDSWQFEHYFLFLKSSLATSHIDTLLGIIPALTRPGFLSIDQASACSALLLKYKRPDEAIELLNSLDRDHPNEFVVLFQLGESYASKMKWDQAELFYQKALDVGPDDLQTLVALSRVARAENNLERSLSYLLKARKIAPDSRTALYEFGVTALQMNLVLDALPAFERLYALSPAEPAYVYMLSIACYRHDEKQRAETLLRKYIELRPSDPIGYYVLGETLYSVRRYPEAKQVLGQSLKLGLVIDSEYLLGLIAENDGDSAQAFTRFQHVISLAPNHAGARTAFGTIFLKRGDIAHAREELEQAIKLDDQQLQAYYQLSIVYGKMGERDLAKQMTERADALRAEARDREKTAFKLVEPPAGTIRQ